MHKLPLFGLVVVMSVAGCAGLGAMGSDASTSPASTVTQTPTASQPATTTTTATPYPAWQPPAPPNRHLENKIEAGRIPAVEFVNTVPGANGTGYSAFDLAVTADTRMANVDPPAHGDVEGEPYFIVYVNEKRFARKDAVPMRENGTFLIELNPRGLEQFEPGELDIKIRLYDEDSQWDDIYGVWTGTVEYSPT